MTTLQASTMAHTQPERAQRTWGWPETVTEAAGHKVKRILVHAGQRLSLQKHAQRAEHCDIAPGQARRLARSNLVTYLPSSAIFHCASSY